MRIEFTYQYANLLFLVYGLLILFYFYARKKSKKRFMKFGNFSTLKKVTQTSLFDPSKLLLFLHIAAITSLILGISSPVLVEEVKVSDTNYVIAFDTSASMFTDDIEPTRFEAGKEAANSFVDRLGNSSSVGLVSYSGKAVEETDGLVFSEKLPFYIDNLEMGQEPGTAIGEALVSSASMFEKSSNRSGRILLMTDGSNNAGLSVNESVETVLKHNLSVDVIGIGEVSEEQVGEEYSNVGGYNASRRDFPNLNSERLERISERTGGSLRLVKNGSEMKEAFRIEEENEETRRNLSEYFSLFGVFALLLEWVLKTTSFASIP